MSSYSQRHHRRRLLLPPGMLALAGLLWLGAVMLQGWGPRLHRQNVMQLTLPPRPTPDIIWQMPRHMRDFVPESQPALRYSRLAKWRDWSNIEFGRGRVADSLVARRLERIVRQVAAEQDQAHRYWLWPARLLSARRPVYFAGAHAGPDEPVQHQKIPAGYSSPADGFLHTHGQPEAASSQLARATPDAFSR
jgi:hypothetical protein